jgi:hypothetical protein
VLYDPTDHALLSEAAKALQLNDVDQFNEQAALAQTLLELDDSSFSGADAATATRAVAMQVNYQIEMGLEGFTTNAVSRGSRSVVYKQGTGSRPVLVFPLAKRLVENLSGGWDTGISLRR